MTKRRTTACFVVEKCRDPADDLTTALIQSRQARPGEPTDAGVRMRRNPDRRARNHCQRYSSNFIVEPCSIIRISWRSCATTSTLLSGAVEEPLC